MNKSHDMSLEFTLTELIVVVLVLFLLSGMLVPAMNMERASSRKAVCMYNLRQLGVASAVYMSDYDGYLPALWQGKGRCQSGYEGAMKLNTWAELLAPNVDFDKKVIREIQLKEQSEEPLGIFTCPENERSYPTDPDDRWRVPIDYAPSNMMFSETHLGDSRAPIDRHVNSEYIRAGRFTQLRGPEAVLLVDNHGNRSFAFATTARYTNPDPAMIGNTDGGVSPFAAKHKDGCNWLTAGGSVHYWHWTQYDRGGEKRRYHQDAWGESWE